MLSKQSSSSVIYFRTMLSIENVQAKTSAAVNSKFSKTVPE